MGILRGTKGTILCVPELTVYGEERQEQTNKYIMAKYTREYHIVKNDMKETAKIER